MAVSNVEIRVNANNAVAQLNRLNGVAGTTAGTFSRLRSAAAGLGVGLIAKSAIQAAASFRDLQTRLKLVTSEYGEYEKAQKLVSRAAKTFGLSNREAAEGVADIFTRLRPLGIGLADIESSFIGFNTVARLSGVSAAGASAAFTQLAQALGSGRLQGDEFRSIAEQIPGLLGAVSLETGVAVGDLKEFASDGKLTTDILIRALKRVEKEGAGKIAAIIKDSDVQRFKNFQNASDELSIAIGDKLLPAVTPLIDGATELIKVFGKLPEPIQTGTIAVIGLAGAAAILGPAITTVSGALAALSGGAALKSAVTGLAVMGEKAMAAAAGKTALASAVTAANVKITASTVALGALKLALLALPYVAVAAGITALGVALFKANERQKKFNELVKTGAEEAVKAAVATEKLRRAQAQQRIDDAPDGGRMGKTSPFIKRMKRIVADADDRIAQLQGRLKKIGEEDDDDNGGGNNLLDLDGKRKDISERMLQLNNQLRAAQEGEQKRIAATLNLMIRKQEIAESEMLPLERRDALNQAHFQFRQDIKQLDQEIADQAARDYEARMKAQDELRKAIAEQNRMYEELDETFRTGIVDSILDAVEGTKSLTKGLAGVLRQMARLILQQQLLNALKGFSIFGGGGGGTLPGSAPPMTEGAIVTPTGFQGQFAGFAANGGPVRGGKSYIVGERGPELFTPGMSGNITPNHEMGGANVTVNVDASGSSVEGDADQASQLGRAIGIAVQQELVKQKRPGGLLAT